MAGEVGATEVVRTSPPMQCGAEGDVSGGATRVLKKSGEGTPAHVRRSHDLPSSGRPLRRPGRGLRELRARVGLRSRLAGLITQQPHRGTRGMTPRPAPQRVGNARSFEREAREVAGESLSWSPRSASAGRSVHTDECCTGMCGERNGERVPWLVLAPESMATERFTVAGLYLLASVSRAGREPNNKRDHGYKDCG